MAEQQLTTKRRRRSVLWRWQSRLGRLPETTRRLIQALGVELNHMPVGVADVDLREPGDGMGLQDHAVRIVGMGILPIAFRAKELHRRAITRYANREMDVAGVERLRTQRGAAVNDQVHTLGIAKLKPGAREIEWRPGDLFDR